MFDFSSVKQVRIPENTNMMYIIEKTQISKAYEAACHVVDIVIDA